MTDHTENLERPIAPSEASGAAPIPNEGHLLADLADRLDALVESYSDETEVPARSESSGPTDTLTSTSSSEAGQNEVLSAESSDDSSRASNQALADPAEAECQCELAEDLRTAKIMIIDDEESNVMAVQYHLKKEGYQEFITTTEPENAIHLLTTNSPDVVLLDIRMPGVNGLDILRARKMYPSLKHVPVIVLTASTDPSTKRHALDLGASDFLTKPLDPNDLVPRVKNALIVKKHYDQKASQAAHLEELVRRRTAELVQSRQELILSLARAAEHRDNETGNHVLRVGRYARIIAQELHWPEPQIEILELAAQLHDVGKIGVPDSILFKPGRLEPQEYDVVKNHCAWGVKIIGPLRESDSQMYRSHTRLGESILHVRGSATLMMASRIAQTHHENWDGSGYPLGLAGEDIPIEGRITAIADVYDALSTRRPYKEAYPREQCFDIMEELRCKKFDPRLLDYFFSRKSDIIATQLDLMDLSTDDDYSVRQRRESPSSE
jgi:putative two-component system response regulator